MYFSKDVVISKIMVTPPNGRPRPRSQPPRRIGPLRMVARLLLGTALTGSDELERRFGNGQQVYRPTPAERDRLLASETESDRRRYAVLGATSELTGAAQRGIASLGGLADRTYRAFSQALRPVSQSRLAQPVNQRIDRYAARGDSILRRWIEVGRAEEQLSRSLARDATTETIEGTLDYLARSPEMDELMGEQSFDLVGEMVEEVQERSRDTNILFKEWFYTAVLRRPPPRSTPTGTSSARSQAESPQDWARRN